MGYTISESVRQSSVGGSANVNFVLCQRLVPPCVIVLYHFLGGVGIVPLQYGVLSSAADHKSESSPCRLGYCPSIREVCVLSVVRKELLAVGCNGKVGGRLSMIPSALSDSGVCVVGFGCFSSSPGSGGWPSPVPSHESSPVWATVGWCPFGWCEFGSCLQ